MKIRSEHRGSRFERDDYGGRGKIYDFDDYDDQDKSYWRDRTRIRMSTVTKTMTRKRIGMMSPFPPLAKPDRLRKNGGLRFAGDGKPLQNNLRAGQQALSLMAISFRSKTSAPN